MSPPRRSRSWLPEGNLDTLLAQIVSREELPDIIQSAIERTCHHLGADRVFVFQFQAHLQCLRFWQQGQGKLPVSWDDPQWQLAADCVTYEARSHDSIPSLLYEPAAKSLLSVAAIDRLRHGICAVTEDPADWLADRTDAHPADRDTPRPATWQLSAPISGTSGREQDSWGLLVVQWLNPNCPTSEAALGLLTADHLTADDLRANDLRADELTDQPAMSQLVHRKTQGHPRLTNSFQAVGVDHGLQTKPKTSNKRPSQPKSQTKSQPIATPKYYQDPDGVTWINKAVQLLTIAVHQASLEAQLQQQKQHFERMASDRAQTLQDALVGAQAASRAKSEFLAAMSHELRTPLTCTIGLSATLLRWSFGQLNQRQRDYLQIIHDSGEHLLRLIENILNVAQMEAGHVSIACREFSITRLTQMAVEAVQDRTAERDLTLSLAIDIPNTDDHFVADPEALSRVLVNLLTNAIKFTPRSGSIGLRVWREGDGLVMQVEDTGIGIPEDRITQLFEKFQQLDTSYHRNYGGLGLGLALTKYLVDLHKGWIEVESTVGSGSTFTVWIPAQKATTPPADIVLPTDNEESFWRPQGTIVAFDGHDDRATVTCDLLTAAGYQVVSTADGLTAIDQLDILQPDVAIVSLRLAGSNGWELVSTLRDRPATSNLPILLVGDTPDLESQKEHEHLQNLRIDAYLSEADGPETLIATVNRLVCQAKQAQRPLSVL